MAHPLRVVMVSKAMVVGTYQRKAEELARLGVDLTVLIPPTWRDARGEQRAEFLHTQGYTLRTIPCRRIGDFHLHHYPTLPAELDALRPALLHMDEEPYNLATWLALRAAQKRGIAATFFTWQNLRRTYPPPFRQMEAANYRRVKVAIAGSEEAAGVLRSKGFAGEVQVIPQFGVDPQIFYPAAAVGESPATGTPLRIGYAGGLLPEKGIDTLLRACARLDGAWSLRIVGEGRERTALGGLAAELGIAERVTFAGRCASREMPAVYQTLDVVVLPSRTTPSWKEQFGRVLVEAMACGVPVVGSDSGEIPHVIGAAGLVFAEGDVEDLRSGLQRLLDAPGERARLAEAGRARVVACYTMARIAEQTVNVYERLMG